MRLRKKPWIESAIVEYADFIDLQAPLARRGQWREAFDGQQALHVEIGCGKGAFLAGLSEQQPDTAFIGIEAQLGVIYYAVLKAQAREAKNLRFVHGDAAHLTEWFADGEVDQLYLNFSDPWPKNRQAKRRLTHRNFLAVYRRIIKPGGRLLLKTDNQPLFAFSLEEFAAAGLVVEAVSWDLHKSGLLNPAMTEYETKFSRLGQPICFCQVRFE